MATDHKTGFSIPTREEAIEEMQALRGQDLWDEHWFFPRAEWREEVAADNTQLGYWEWAEGQLQTHFDEIESGAATWKFFFETFGPWLASERHAKNPNLSESWGNNFIQFPRLIEEAQAAGAFTPEVLHYMAESMDLTTSEVTEIMDRAQVAWDEIKARIA